MLCRLESCLPVPGIAGPLLLPQGSESSMEVGKNPLCRPHRFLDLLQTKACIESRIHDLSEGVVELNDRPGPHHRSGRPTVSCRSPRIRELYRGSSSQGLCAHLCRPDSTSRDGMWTNSSRSSFRSLIYHFARRNLDSRTIMSSEEVTAIDACGTRTSKKEPFIERGACASHGSSRGRGGWPLAPPPGSRARPPGFRAG